MVLPHRASALALSDPRTAARFEDSGAINFCNSAMEIRSSASPDWICRPGKIAHRDCTGCFTSK